MMQLMNFMELKMKINHILKNLQYSKPNHRYLSLDLIIIRVLFYLEYPPFINLKIINNLIEFKFFILNLIKLFIY